MKRWAYVTVGLYALILLLLTLPVAVLCFHQWSSMVNGVRVWSFDFRFNEAAEAFQTWGYWLWLGVLVTAQFLLLLVPVAAAKRRPTARRRLLVPVVVASFLLANLFLAGVFAMLVAPMGDDASVVIETPAGLTTQLLELIPGLTAHLTTFGMAPDSTGFYVMHILGVFVVFWLIWALVFYHFAQSDDAETLTQRATRWLLRGSILELLVAVPCHIIVRQRNDCCAPMVSFWGIVTGISVMLLSFGPGVFFLFAARIRRKEAKSAPPIIQ